MSNPAVWLGGITCDLGLLFFISSNGIISAKMCIWLLFVNWNDRISFEKTETVPKLINCDEGMICNSWFGWSFLEHSAISFLFVGFDLNFFSIVTLSLKACFFFVFRTLNISEGSFIGSLILKGGFGGVKPSCGSNPSETGSSSLSIFFLICFTINSCKSLSE